MTQSKQSKRASARPGPRRGTSDPITPTPLASGTADVNAAVAAAPGRLLTGFSMTENAASPGGRARVRLLHGATVGAGVELFDVTLGAGESARENFDGVAIPNGVSIDRVEGTTKITLFTKVQ